MLRLGIHYVEPRRLGFFAAEQALLATGFALAATLVARSLGRELLPGALAAGVIGTGLSAWFLLSLADLHDLRVALAPETAVRRLLRVLGAAALASAFVVGALRRDPAAMPAAGGVLGASLALLGSRATLAGLGRRRALHTRVFLVGEGQAAHRLAREIARDDGVEIVGFAGPNVTELADRARAASATLVVVAADERRGLPLDELLRCRASGVPVTDAAVFAARVLHRLPVELVRPADLVFGDGFVRPRWVRLGRRALSVFAATLLLLASSPLLFAAALAIKLDSAGPVLFRQRRVGRDGLVFDMLKLRTMHVGAEREGARWAREGDPRVTRAGRILRRFRVDELPQLVNVLRGDMELCGPRPERPEFVATLRRHIPYYDLRHLVPPGITGWAQVSYPYAASVEEAREKLQYDLYYVRHLGVAFDVFILLLTARTILLGRGAR